MVNGKFPITVVIPTLNAAGHLDELLDSVEPYAQDIWIVDSRSIDATVDIALRRGIKIVQRPFVNFGDCYRFLLKNIPYKTPWLFFVMQDERFSESVVSDLDRLFNKEGIPDGVDGYWVKWRLWFMGRPLHAESNVLRLLRVGKCDVTQVLADEHFLVEGEERYLKCKLEHKDTLNLHEWYEKQNLWTTMGAMMRIQELPDEEKLSLFGSKLQRKMLFKRLLNRIPLGHFFMFWYYYIKFGAWKDGLDGWRWARLRIWVNKVTNMKEKEMRRIGVPKRPPEAKHGDFDPRIMEGDLQKQLLPELVAEWKSRTHQYV